MSQLSKNLKKIRERKNMSMSMVSRRSKAIAEKIGDHRAKITQGYISRLESGKEDNPSFLKLLCLCRVYRVKMQELVK